MKFVRHRSAARFLERARDWLVASEAENNLVLGLAMDRADAEEDEEDAFFATLQEGEWVLGCVFRTPPFPLGLTDLPTGGIPLVAQKVAMEWEALPAVVGPLKPIRAFASIWCAMQGVEADPGLEMGIYALEQPVPLPRTAPGRMRVGVEDDLPEVREWFRRFTEDTGVPAGDAEERTREMVAARRLFLWEHQGVTVSMAAALGETPRGVRIAFVYTPPAERRQGYAGTLVAQLSRLMLDRGRDFCFLYTDLANPTSNRIYKRMGYERVATAGEIRFTDKKVAVEGAGT